MKRKVDLFFNYDIDNYKAGYAYTLEISEVEEKRLIRRGCIYPSKDAKYYQEQKPVKEILEEKPVKDEVKDVDHKEDSEQTKVQAKRSKSSKHKE